MLPGGRGRGRPGSAFAADGGGARGNLRPAPKVQTVNPVGSGDSLLAGYLYAALRGLPDGEALKFANAAGAANAAMFPAARVGWAEILPLWGGARF